MHDSRLNSSNDVGADGKSCLDFGLRESRQRTDRTVFGLLIAQWALILLGGFGIAWQSMDFRFEQFSSMVIGAGLLSAAPLWMLLQFPRSWQARWTVVVTQGALSSLLWALSGGRVETQVHLFVWIVVLSWYRDWRCLPAVGALALAGDAFVLAAGRLPDFELQDHWSSVSMWWIGVIAETAVATVIVLLDRRSLAENERRDAEAAALQSELRQSCDAAIRELTVERDRLKGEIQGLKDRQATQYVERSNTAGELSSLRRDVRRQASTLADLTTRRRSSSLPKDWHKDWMEIRRVARHLMQLVEPPSLMQSAVPAAGPSNDRAEASINQSKSDRKALLVVRNPLQKAAAVDALNSEGFTVDTVATGPSAVYSVMLSDYELVLVDIDLPGEEGFDTVEGLRLLPVDKVRKSVSILALTNELTPDRILRCTQVGVDGMVLKPLTQEQLRKAVEEGQSPDAGNGTTSSWSWNGAGLTH